MQTYVRLAASYIKVEKHICTVIMVEVVVDLCLVYKILLL